MLQKTVIENAILMSLLTLGEQRGAPSFHHTSPTLLTNKKGVGGVPALPSQLSKVDFGSLLFSQLLR